MEARRVLQFFSDMDAAPVCICNCSATHLAFDTPDAETSPHWTVGAVSKTFEFTSHQIVRTMLKTNQHAALLSAFETNWQTEMENHATYRALALTELDPRRRYVMRGLAAAEKHHARLWAAEISSLGALNRIIKATRTDALAPFRVPASWAA